MSTLVIEPHYLPCIEYFCAILRHRKIILERHEYFGKQSYRSRCYINTSQGSLMLVVPASDKNGKVAMGEIQLNPSQRWRNNHWRTIQSAYRNAPFFEYYSDELHDILFQAQRYLFDLNKNLLLFCLRSLKVDVTIAETLSYQKDYPAEMVDFRNVINAKKHHSTRSLYQPVQYTQVFGNAFVENLSVLDVLFCEGSNALRSIKTSMRD